MLLPDLEKPGDPGSGDDNVVIQHEDSRVPTEERAPLSIGVMEILVLRAAMLFVVVGDVEKGPGPIAVVRHPEVKVPAAPEPAATVRLIAN
jgi:hypothetical protein